MGDLLKIGDREFAPGESGIVDLPVGHIITRADLGLRVHVHRSRTPGPRLFVSACIHGDEINGAEIARRLLRSRLLRKLVGDLIVVPVVNIPGFLGRSRYLPDRRDLNRLFPGASEGSFGARIARSFYREVVRGCSHGIDLHTGASGRSNLPQTRVCFDVPGAREMAAAFGAPVVLESSIREGSLRAALSDKNIPVVLYEGGEAGRLDTAAVKFGLHGVISVMRYLEMLPPPKSTTHVPKITYSKRSFWVRSPAGGIFRGLVSLGKAVQVGQKIGIVGDPFTRKETPVLSTESGIVIGRANQAVVDEGDAVYHVALTRDDERAERHIERAGEALLGDIESPVFDDPMMD